MHPIEALERYWNHMSFRPLQEDIITAVLNNEDTFALLPTGGGKSICFQIPALIKPGICIVVSPLIALMQDQVNSLKQKGIKAVAITSGISYSELDTSLDNCIYGNYKFLYLSPERLQQTLVQERIQRMNVNLIAVDEAHCISQWGNDFRPAYKSIVTLRELQPSVNCIALTATAKSKVVEDIIESLDFIDPKVFKASFKRENISYQVIKTEDKNYHLEHILNENKGASIIYARSRKATVTISDYLLSKGFETTYYHGGLTNIQKKERLHLWTTNQKPIMVATTAFGMGIDKPDVKSIIHYNLPESLESYYQEAGRAGRNGNDAVAVILKKNIDEDRLKGQFLSALPSIDAIKYVYKKLCNYFQISYGEGQNTLHQLNFKTFCHIYQLKTTLTFNALKILDSNSIISLDQRFNYRTTVQFKVSNTAIFKYLESNKSQNKAIKALLRTYGGILDYITKINLELVANKAETTIPKLLEILKDLERHNIIDLNIANTDSEITFIKPREDEKTINPIIPIIELQQNLKKEHIQSVIRYTNNDTICKSILLLNYFDEDTTEECGRCSICLSKSNSDASVLKTTIKEQILKELEDKNQSSRELLNNIKCGQVNLLDALTFLIESEKITITATNTYKLK
ncbi:MAG: RecQ family ATP-dependent DNA helicase [Winogradskyella sp.]|uniref:RecQ family ATP-dependent DNA helicase n=1 Tax=Winogradskyella sp. TaxID=1883156 RepID=UPI0017BBF9DE|nr:RecQ family ATP-dependent DNA helicase [Winogradskyella sp.]MBT8244696.1 RecQ family ATP-dependent DNA helicase [Winogradskyella sp.]NNK23871.1 RecQ family ATP-dependent DNA helicase [Winogradskyella sp.]